MKICKSVCQNEISFEHIHAVSEIVKNNFVFLYGQEGKEHGQDKSFQTAHQGQRRMHKRIQTGMNQKLS